MQKWRYRYKSKKNRKQIKLIIANNGKPNWKKNPTLECAITAGVKHRYAENEQKWWQVEFYKLEDCSRLTAEINGR